MEIAPDRAAFRAAWPGRGSPPEWAIGAAFAAEDRILLLSGARAPGGDVLATFRHEYAHLALSRLAGGRPLPAWLQEGFAIYHAGEWTLRRAMNVSGRLLGGRVPGLDDLAGFLSLGPDDAEAAYSLSFHFIAFLHREYGAAGFRRFVDALRRGEEPKAALEAMSGGYWGAVEAKWRDTLKVRYRWIPAGAIGTGAWALGAAALFAGWARRKRRDRRILAVWEEVERFEDEAAAEALRGEEEGGDDEEEEDPGPPGGWVH